MKTSLANAVKRKTHKERSQPAARLKYGLLEKRKDYVLRAKDFHRKEKTIKSLRRKAEERNPDEFYFAMEKKKTKDGVHDGRLSTQNKYSQEELALMKSQDVQYLSMKEKTEKQKIERLKGSLHFIGAAPKANHHTVFVDSAAEVKHFSPSEYFNTPKELLGRTYNRPKQDQLNDPSAVVLPKHVTKPTAAAKKAERKRVAAYTELSQRLTRQQTLARTASHLAYQREMAGKGRKRKLTKKELAAARQVAEGPAEDSLHSTQQGRVFKWKRERSK